MHLFAYGTLMCPEIMRRVTGSLPAQLPARLEGYRRGPLARVDYPAITPERNGAVDGLLYLDLPAEAWPRLNAFEDKIYYRSPVKVTLADGSTLAAETYILRPEHLDRLGESEWSYAEFLATARERFELDYVNFPAAGNS